LAPAKGGGAPPDACRVDGASAGSAASPSMLAGGRRRGAGKGGQFQSVPRTQLRLRRREKQYWGQGSERTRHGHSGGRTRLGLGVAVGGGRVRSAHFCTVPRNAKP
jgi:hypothetical protein